MGVVTDPFVPTGRELDEGVTGPGLEKAKEARPGLLKRIFGRPHKHTGKNLTEIVLSVSDDVAARPPGLRTRAPRNATDDGSAGPSNGAKSPAKITASPKLATRFEPGAEFVGSVIALSKKPTPAVKSLCDTFLATGKPAAGDLDLLSWWLKADTATPPSLTLQTRATLPEDVLTVFDFLAHDAKGPKRLTTYQSSCAKWDEYDRAAKDLTRKARNYPSLESLAASIKERDVDAAKQHIRYDSAAWHECRLAISEAMTALEATMTLGTRPAMTRFPREVASKPPIQQAVISTICTPSSVASTLDASRDSLAATPVPDSDPAVQQLVVRLLKQ